MSRIAGILSLFLVCGALLLLPHSPQAKVHTWKDESGVLHFSDKQQSKAPAKPSKSLKTRRSKPHPPQASGPKGKGPLFMWKVISKTNTVFMLGSMHIAKKGLYPLDGRIEDAFDHCDALAVESDVEGNAARLQSLVARLGMYPVGDSLDKHISERTMEMLGKFAGPSNVMFMQMRPWLVATQLQSMKLQQMGYDQNQGIDRHFLNRARNTGKKVLELEDMAHTLQILADASDKDPDQFLYYTLLELERQEDVVGEISATWKQGDASGMYNVIFRELNKRSEFKEFGKRLFDDRNKSMAERISQYLDGSSPVFVVVGAGHLVGPKGIPTLLERKGYTVRQVGK